MYIVNVQVYLIQVSFRMILILFQLRKFLTRTVAHSKIFRIQNL